jgi:hypothetical protein
MKSVLKEAGFFKVYIRDKPDLNFYLARKKYDPSKSICETRCDARKS